jgi:predicted ATPase/class 3 adenylate cyclase
VETLTFLFTDIEGSTAVLRRVGDGVYAQILADHHALIRSVLAAHDGRELNTLGDGFFAAFPSPRECAAAVLNMQQALDAHAWPGGERVRVRMGVHTGEASQTPATGVLGLDVHRAARIAAVAYGGQIVLSETAAALMRDVLPDGAALRDLGAHRLKDLGRAEQLFQLSGPGLTPDFPPLRSLGNPALPNNLPVQPSKFVGRSRELSEVRALAESARLVTLTGAGGCGKTRLALQTAAELLDGSGDGVWLTELAAVTDEAAVPSAVAAALGIPVPGQAVAEALLGALVPQDALIVLDNCEHLIGACAKLADAILRRCPRVHLLATSREPLGIGGEVIYRVPSLSVPDSLSATLPEELLSSVSAALLDAGDSDLLAARTSDAVALFVDRAAEQGVTLAIDARTAPLLVSICRRLDGMPLAIELAAARLRSLSLSELHNRLDQRFRLLTGGSRAAMARQQTLRAAVDWSYSLLGPAEQRLLRRLSVLAESFDVRAAEAVCGFGEIDPFDVAELLGSLVDKSLVQAEQAGETLRYRLLETIRQFAAERLIEDVAGLEEAEAVRSAHCEHFLAVAERVAANLAGPDQAAWMRRLCADDANLRRAVDYAVAAPDRTPHALRFFVALRRYWMSPQREEDALALMQPVLARPDAGADPALLGRALITAIAAGRPNMAAMVRRFGEQAVEIGRRLDDEWLLTEALGMLSGTFYFTGEAEKGLPYGEESVERARRLGDDVLLGTCLMGLMLCLADDTDPARSDAVFAEGIACTLRSGDRLVEYILRNNNGVRALLHGDLRTARTEFEAAARSELASVHGRHLIGVNLGWVQRLEGDLDAAQATFVEALRVSRRIGDRAGVAYSTLGLACLASDLGEQLRASQLHGAAQAALERCGEEWQAPERGYREANIDRLRDALGAAEFDLGYTDGIALSFDDAFRLAMSARPVAASA